MHLRPIVLGGLVALIWGLCFVIIQASLPSAVPLLLAGMRALIGGAVLVAWAILSRRLIAPRASGAGSSNADPGGPLTRGADSRPAGLPPTGLLLVLAVANAAVAFGAMYLAAGQSEAAVASILAGGQPVVLAAAGWALFGEHAAVRTGAGLAIAMAGVILVATATSGTTSAAGVGLSLLATVAPALGTVLMRRIGPSVDLLATTSAQFLLGGAMLVAVSGLFEPWAELTWSLGAVLGLLILGVLGTGLAYLAWFWLLAQTSLVNLASVLFLVPVVGVVAGIVAGDRPAPVVLAGTAAVLAGIGFVALSGTSKRSPELEGAA